jgi:hypothetical protein
LQPLSRPKNVGETRFSMETQSENAAGHANRWLGGFELGCVGIPVLLEKLRRGCRPIEFVRIRFVPPRLDLGKLFLALKKLVDWIKR